MKKREIIITVAQTVLIIFLALYILLKSVEMNKYRILADESNKTATKQRVLYLQQVEKISIELKKCQEEK